MITSVCFKLFFHFSKVHASEWKANSLNLPIDAEELVPIKPAAINKTLLSIHIRTESVLNRLNKTIKKSIKAIICARTKHFNKNLIKANNSLDIGYLS